MVQKSTKLQYVMTSSFLLFYSCGSLLAVKQRMQRDVLCVCVFACVCVLPNYKSWFLSILLNAYSLYTYDTYVYSQKETIAMLILLYMKSVIVRQTSKSRELTECSSPFDECGGSCFLYGFLSCVPKQDCKICWCY